MRRVVLVLLSLAAQPACELREISLAEPEDVVIVEAILRTGELTQKVLVHRSHGLGAPPSAAVSVTTPEGVILGFTAADASVCLLPADSIGAATSACYVWSRDMRDPPILAGRSYALRVELSDGRILTGSTRVPGDFEILEPAERTCELAPDTTFELRWSTAADAWVYIAEANLFNLRAALRPRGIEVPTDPLRLVGLSVSREDTTIVFPSEFGLFDRFDDDLADVLVALQTGMPSGTGADVTIGAADRNYVNWIRGGNFNPSGTVRVPSVHGEGGTGVFGSVVTRTRSIVTGPETHRPPC